MFKLATKPYKNHANLYYFFLRTIQDCTLALCVNYDDYSISSSVK